MLAIVAVGLSRAYLGVHFPSDVVGGFAAGGAWLSVCVTGADIARRRERVAAAGGLVRDGTPGRSRPAEAKEG